MTSSTVWEKGRQFSWVFIFHLGNSDNIFVHSSKQLTAQKLQFSVQVNHVRTDSAAVIQIQVQPHQSDTDCTVLPLFSLPCLLQGLHQGV